MQTLPCLLSRVALSGAAFLALAACDGAPVVPLGGAMLTGDWNGAHLSLTLGAQGGTTEYDCAHGGISEPLILATDGTFEVAGVHVREMGGPVREGEVPDSLPAHYFGRWDGGALTMRVVVMADTLGPYVLRKEAPVRLVKCL